MRPDYSTGAPLTYYPHLEGGKSPTAMERRDHLRTPQEGRQDGVQKLPCISLESRARKVLLKVVTRRLSDYCETKGLLPKE